MTSRRLLGGFSLSDAAGYRSERRLKTRLFHVVYLR